MAHDVTAAYSHVVSNANTRRNRADAHDVARACDKGWPSGLLISIQRDRAVLPDAGIERRRTRAEVSRRSAEFGGGADLGLSKGAITDSDLNLTTTELARSPGLRRWDSTWACACLSCSSTGTRPIGGRSGFWASSRSCIRTCGSASLGRRRTRSRREPRCVRSAIPSFLRSFLSIAPSSTHPIPFF